MSTFSDPANPTPPNAPSHRQVSRVSRWSRRGLALGISAAELLLPSTCRLCDACVAPGRDFCASCAVRLEASEAAMRSACRRCGRPGAVGDREGPCEFCRGRKQHFDRCIALWTYEGLVRQAVVSSKYGTQMALAEALGVRLATRVFRELAGDPAGGAWPQLITPVPSHWLRRLHRGGGGCRIVAAAVHRSLRRISRNCVYRDCLRVTRRIEKQAWLGEKERESNVRGAFRLAGSPRFGRRQQHLGGRAVLLVDDVMTTGATSNEIARVLKAAGAGRVVVAVVARALGR